MENARTALDILSGLKQMGIALSIDDFGTGYSSLSYLTRFPFNYLKVDRSFVMQMSASEEDRRVVQTIVSLAHDMKKKIIAEGIETEEQLADLRQLECEIGQGYLFAKPLPPDEAQALLTQDPTW